MYDLNQGEVNDGDGKLRLTFSLEKRPDGLLGLADELIPVAWGSRRYLIAADKMIDFCNFVNAGREPRDKLYGSHLLRRGDESKPASGLPAIPDEFKRYLLTTPIEAEVIEVKERRGKKTAVRLNRGEKHGLLPGVELHVVEPNYPLVPTKVIASDQETSDAVMVRILDRKPDPHVGWKLSTRWPWRASKD